MTPEQEEELLTQSADAIVKRGMAVPAILALEMHKPVSNFMAHTALMFCGFIAPVIGAELFDKLTRLLSKRENVDRLVDAIEKRQMEEQSAGK